MNAPWTPPPVLEAKGGRFTGDDMRAFADAQIDAHLLLGNLQQPVAYTTCRECRFFFTHPAEVLGECRRYAPRERGGYVVYAKQVADGGCGEGYPA